MGLWQVMEARDAGPIGVCSSSVGGRSGKIKTPGAGACQPFPGRGWSNSL